MSSRSNQLTVLQLPIVNLHIVRTSTIDVRNALRNVTLHAEVIAQIKRTSIISRIIQNIYVLIGSFVITINHEASTINIFTSCQQVATIIGASVHHK